MSDSTIVPHRIVALSKVSMYHHHYVPVLCAAKEKITGDKGKALDDESRVVPVCMHTCGRWKHDMSIRFALEHTLCLAMPLD